MWQVANDYQGVAKEARYRIEVKRAERLNLYICEIKKDLYMSAAGHV